MNIIGNYKQITIFYFVIVLLNILLFGSSINMLLSLVQYIIVIKCILAKKYNEAIFYHLTFVATSLAPTTAFDLQEGASSICSYARIKIGPVCFFYLISLYLLFISTNRKSKHYLSGSLFSELTKCVLFLAVSGFVLGLIGFVFLGNYDFSSFLLYGTYIFMVYVNMRLLMNFCSKELLDMFYKNLPPIMGAGILATAAAYYVFGLASSYGVLNMILQPDIVYFGVLFFMGFYKSPYKKYVLIVSILYILMNLTSATGHNIIIIAIGLMYFLYYTYFSKDLLASNRKEVTKFRKDFTVLLPIIVVLIVAYANMGTLFLIKSQNVLSLFSTNVGEVDTSPYVRIATTMNIFENNKYNPIGLLFGQGYGGYFTDQLNMFVGLDLSDGGWPDKDVSTGRFTRGHDTFATVPLVNGFGGLLYLMYICYKYAKAARKSFMAYAIFPWIVFTFYFNIIYAVIGICCLFAAEYELSNIIQYENTNSRLLRRSLS